MPDIHDSFLDDLFSHDPEYDDDDDYTKELRCRHCGSENVYWVESPKGTFVLYDMTSCRHKCRPEDRTELHLDAFEDLE